MMAFAAGMIRGLLADLNVMVMHNASVVSVMVETASGVRWHHFDREFIDAHGARAAARTARG